MIKKEVHPRKMIYKREKTKVLDINLGYEMKPGMRGKVYQRLADVVDGGKMLIKEEERDEKDRTDCKDEQLVGEKGQNETVREFVLMQQPNDDKAEPVTPNRLETSGKQCAARIHSEVRVVLPKLETVKGLHLENKCEKMKELSEKSGFRAETERSKAKHCCAEFAEDLRRGAIVVLERCALLPSPTPTPTVCKIENETDEGNSLRKTAISFKLENKSEKPRESEKCDFEFESERSNFTEFDEVLRRKAIVVLERCVLPASSSETPMNECKLKLKNETDGENSVSAETEEEKPKIIIETAEEKGLGFSDGAEKCRQVEVTTWREMDAPQQRVNETEIKKEVVEEEVEIIFESYVTNVETQIRSEPIVENKVDFTFQGGNENTIRINIEDAREKLSFEDVRRKREMSAQQEKCLATNAENYSGFMVEEMPEQRNRCMVPSTEKHIEAREKELLKRREKRGAGWARPKRKRKENETPEQCKKRLAKQAEYWKKWTENITPERREKRRAYLAECRKKAIERGTSQQLEKRHLADAERCEKVKDVEPTDITEERLSPYNGNENIIRINTCTEVVNEKLSFEDVRRKREASAQQEKCLATNAENYRGFMVEEMPEQRNRCMVPSTEKHIEAREKELLKRRKKRGAGWARPKRKRKENETPEQYNKRLAKQAEYWREKRRAYLAENRKKAIERGTSQQLEKRHLADAERCEKVKDVEPTDITEERLSPYNGNENIIRINTCNEVVNEKRSFEDVMRKRKICVQREKCLATNAESVRIEGARELAEKYKRHLATQTENYRSFFVEETPEQRKKRLAKQAECWRKWVEKLTPERREKRLAYVADYNRKKAKERTMAQQLEKHHLADAERCERVIEVEPIDINEDGLSPHDDISRWQLPHHDLRWTEGSTGRDALEAVQNNHPTYDLAAQKFDIPDATKLAAIKYNERMSNIADCLFYRQSIDTTIPDVAAFSSAEDRLSLRESNKNNDTGIRKIAQVAVNKRKRTRVENETPEELRKKIIEYMRKWREAKKREQLLEKRRAAIITETKTEEVIDLSKQCGKSYLTNFEILKWVMGVMPSDINEDRLLPQNFNENNNIEQTAEQMSTENAGDYLKQREKRRTLETKCKKRGIERETPKQRKKRLAANCKYSRKWIENETPEQRNERLARHAEYRRKRKCMENEQGEKYLAAMTEGIRMEVNEREMFQQVEKENIAAPIKMVLQKMCRICRNVFCTHSAENFHWSVAEISKKVVEAEPIATNEDRLSPQDYNENNNAGIMKSDPMDAGEVDFPSEDGSITRRSIVVLSEDVEGTNSIVKSEELNGIEAADFSSQHVNENFMKSEFAAFAVEDEEDDEMEIDFEAYVTNVETRIKSEPFDENEGNFFFQDDNVIRIKSEDANEEDFSSAAVKENNISIQSENEAAIKSEAVISAIGDKDDFDFEAFWRRWKQNLCDMEPI